MGRKNRTIGLIVLFATFALVLSGAAIAQEETVSIADKPGIGQYLIGANGLALYYFKNDSPGKSVCTGPCAEKWPVYCYKTSEISIAKGLKMSDFGSFFRNEDKLDHLTYKGMPLYQFTGDQNPGDTNGQGVKGVWFVVKP